MSNDTKKQLVNKYGEPLKHLPAPMASREKIALKIYNYFITQPEANELLAEIISNTATNLKNLGNGTFQIHSNDPKFQEACLNYGSKSIINTALDENLPKAYSLLLYFADLPSYQNSDEELTEISSNMLNELDIRFSQIPELILAKNVCDVQSEITNFLNGGLQKSMTSFQANRIQEKFEDITPYLNFEQRAAGYYNISIIHRVLLGEKEEYKQNQNNAEKECLKKVLEYTSDYKRINYCLNRFGNSLTDKETILSAYRRALSAAETTNDLYKTNLALAECYLENYRPTGFRDTQNEDMEQAELHYQQALSYAKEPEKLGLLQHIAKLQLRQHKIQEWTETETLIAMKFLHGEERCYTLLKIAAQNKELSLPYLEQALKEADKSRRITKPRKRILLQKIAHNLRPIYEQQNDKEKMQQLDNILAKYNSSPNQQLNPLLKYVKKSKQK